MAASQESVVPGEWGLRLFLLGGANISHSDWPVQKFWGMVLLRSLSTAYVLVCALLISKFHSCTICNMRC